ncbi:CBN-SULP-7 protein [Caenorhabditis brenneri]|uniref:CBN-SULP-7 protein n=1 Tax=Caenorhabditis brenneri TaxID=135651 RepID=G0MI40_CAEBE|nr:CBN-SULP-7 protein [Caenorhabditis brenneri]
MRKKEVAGWKNFIPITKWLPNYNIKQNLINDLIGGITVGILHVPQGMAYASLVGLKPVYGLYTSLFPSLIYMFFGTSRHVSLGVFAVVSLMSGSCNLRVTQELAASSGSNLTKAELEVISVNVVKSLGLAIGLIQIILGLVKANYLISYLSDQIILGFTTGAAVHVLTAQLNKILGVALPRHTGIGKLFFIYRDLINSILDDKVNKVTLAVSVVAIVALYVAKYHLTPALCAKTRIPIPYDLFLIVIGTTVSSIFAANSNYHVKIVGPIPTGFPSPALPDVSLFGNVFGDALAIAIVSVVVTVSMGKVIAKKHNYVIDVRQEFFALGIVASTCSMFPCWPASTALARTLINDNAGTKTQISAIFSALVLTLVLFFIGPLMEHLPTCFLSCIVIVALRGMFLHLQNFVTLWKVSKYDWAIFSITFFSTVCLDVVPGLFIGTVSALLFSILRIQRQTCVMFFASSLFYFNCERFEKKVQKIVAKFTGNNERDDNSAEIPMIEKKIKEKCIIFDMRGVSNIDLSGANTLIKIHQELKNKNITFKIRDPNENVAAFLSGVSNSDQLFES